MAIFTVNNLFDSGVGSLRQAIFDANNQADADEIFFDSGLSGGTINLTSGSLNITDSLTISGLGAERLTVSGNNQSRVFLIDDGNSSNQINVFIDGLTVRDGQFFGMYGGGFFNQENLTITNVALINNDAGNAGAIYNTGQLQLHNSLVSQNLGATGPIFNDGGFASISNTTISDHSIAGIGAIVNYKRGELRLANSTITNNDSLDAAVFNSEDSIAIVSNTIIAGNTGSIIPERDDVIGNFISNGYNLIGNGNGSTGFDGQGDQVGTKENPIDPLLGSLQDNGGSTQTYALLTGSPAIDAANPNNFPATDQRGVIRPQGIAPDIGAFEVETSVPVSEPSTLVSVLVLAVVGVRFLLGQKYYQVKRRRF
ncbi:MAG: choice-of-anchor Q domain-containing protein [Xenococcaceae cyanobacterium]